MASDKVKLTIHTSKRHQDNEALPKHLAGKSILRKSQRSFQERLLRNSCFACAVLLGILALGNVRQPWARNVSSTIEKALTMEIDLDKSLGQLRFVQKLMPESALVFFNLNGGSELTLPVQGELSHPFSQIQPWLMFACEKGANACAVADGIVSAVSPMSSGGYGVLIDHGSGLESVTACLDEASVQAGSSVVRGGIIGKSSENLYFELRQNGESADPTHKLGL